jgi:DNA-binding XRE family transcriptional regulator
MYFQEDLRITSIMPRRWNREASFGKRLIALRKARGITQVELAKTLGTTQRTISYYENEGGLPTVLLLGGRHHHGRTAWAETHQAAGQPTEAAAVEETATYRVIAGAGSARGHSLD